MEKLHVKKMTGANKKNLITFLKRCKTAQSLIKQNSK